MMALKPDAQAKFVLRLSFACASGFDGTWKLPEARIVRANATFGNRLLRHRD